MKTRQVGCSIADVRYTMRIAKTLTVDCNLFTGQQNTVTDERGLAFESTHSMCVGAWRASVATQIHHRSVHEKPEVTPQLVDCIPHTHTHGRRTEEEKEGRRENVDASIHGAAWVPAHSNFELANLVVHQRERRKKKRRGGEKEKNLVSELPRLLSVRG
jgi:hypothetical protein